MISSRWFAQVRGGRVSVAALLAVCSLGLVHDAAAQQRHRVSGSGYSARIDTTFAFDKSGSVTLNAANGDIVVTGWSRDVMHVRAVSDDDNIRLDASSSRALLEVAGSRRGSDTRFEVSVPYGVRIVAHSQTGDITIRATRGQVEAHAQNGDIRVDDVTTRLDVTTLSGEITAGTITGDIAISSLSGEVHVTDVRGNVDVGTVSGDIDLRGITAKTVRAKTTSGEVTYDGTIDPAGRYELSTHSGDIGLHVPRDANAQLTVSTWSGTIDSQFPIVLKPGEHGISVGKSKRFTFEIGGGAARIAAETFSGDINISSNGRGAPERR
jgi:DUF4097 and DUF4098 domain-containing protein YvlB